jgi:asparagine synthase (glutamine-hydrolysing)
VCQETLWFQTAGFATADKVMHLSQRLSAREEAKTVSRRLLPREILECPKQGFGTPMAEWLRGPFGQRAQESIRRSSLVERGMIRSDPIDRLFAAHRTGRADWSYHLWNVYNACAWHDRWVARAV